MSDFRAIGASNHSEYERAENDYYATDPKAIDVLVETGELTDIRSKLFDGIWIWEPACGEGHLSKRLEEHGFSVISSDIIQRGYGNVQDYLATTNVCAAHVVTNPPFKLAEEFVRHAIGHTIAGFKVCMFLKIQFLEGKKRKALFEEYPPKAVYVFSSRISCARNGDFEGLKKKGGTVLAYAWFVWEVGYKGETVLKWVN